MPNHGPDADQTVNGSTLMPNKNASEFAHRSIDAEIEAGDTSPDLSSLNKSPAFSRASECHSSEVSIAMPHGSPASIQVSVGQPETVSKWRKFFPRFSAPASETQREPSQMQPQMTTVPDPSVIATMPTDATPNGLDTEPVEARKSEIDFGPHVFSPEEKDPEGKEKEIMHHFTQEYVLAKSFHPEKLKTFDLVTPTDPLQLSNGSERSSQQDPNVIKILAPAIPEPSESSPFPDYETQIVRQLVDLKKTSLKISDLALPSESAQASNATPDSQTGLETNVKLRHCERPPQFELSFNFESSCAIVKVKIFFKATESDFSLPDPLIYTSEKSLPFQEISCSENESGLGAREFKCSLDFDLNTWQAIELSLQHLDPDSLDALNNTQSGLSDKTHTNRSSVISYMSDLFRFDAEDEKMTKGKQRNSVAQFFKRKPKPAASVNAPSFVKSEYVWPLIIVLEVERDKDMEDIQATKQATFAVFEKRPEGGFEIKVQKQKIMTQDGFTFLLSEIYGNKVMNVATANETHEEPLPEENTTTDETNASEENQQPPSPLPIDELSLRGSLIKKNIDILMKRQSKEINLQTLQSLHRVGSSSTVGSIKGRGGSTSTIDASPTLYILNHLRRSEMQPSRESFGSISSTPRLTAAMGRHSSRLSNDRILYLTEQTSALRLSHSPKDIEEGAQGVASSPISTESAEPAASTSTTAAEPMEYDFKECVICLSEQSDTVLFPCRHWCLCQECADVLRKQSKKCPLCRQGIESLIALVID